MKNLLMLTLMFTLTNLYGQSTSDRILLHTGEELAVNISGISERSVTFSYPEETIEYTKSKNIIQEIIFSSGRKLKGSELIVVNGEQDWEKVVITNVPEDVEGLVKKAELYEKSTGTTIFTGSDKIDAKANRKIKMAAAALGAHIIYLQGNTNDKGIRRVNRSIKSGIAYAYR